MVARPPLYRLARGLRLLGLLAVVGTLIFVGLAVYSASRIRPSTNSSSPPGVAPVGNDSVAIRTNLSLANPGYFAIDRITIDALSRLPGSNGTVVARATSPAVSIAPGSTVSVPVSFLVRIAVGPAELLLTHDLTLPTEAWVNATYASLFDVALALAQNLSWGAPFEALNLTPGTPTLQGNGTIAIPLTLSFSNHAGFADDGSLSYILRSSGGASCASGTFSIQAPPSTTYQSTQTVYATGGCNPHGGSISLTFHGSPWTVVLPSEPFP